MESNDLIKAESWLVDNWKRFSYEREIIRSPYFHVIVYCIIDKWNSNEIIILHGEGDKPSNATNNAIKELVKFKNAYSNYMDLGE